MMSKLYAFLIVAASLFAMTAVGMLILVVIADVADWVVPTNDVIGMNP